MYDEKFVFNPNENWVTIAIKNLESKGHILYLRYLLTKRYTPQMITRELMRLGLSVSKEDVICDYYMNVILPAIKKFGVEDVYSTFSSTVSQLRKTNKQGYSFKRNILNYRLHVAGKDFEERLLGFLKYLDVEDLWFNEIISYYGKKEDIPLGKDGNPIIDHATFDSKIFAPAFKIIDHPKRHIIDKMILEEIDPCDITRFAKNEFDLNLKIGDINIYKKMFFNVRARTLEEKISSLEKERKDLEESRREIKEQEIDYGDPDSIENNRIAATSVAQRIEELDESLRLLNSSHQNAIQYILENRKYSKEEILSNIMAKAYERFNQLDARSAGDKSVVDPMMKLARIAMMAADKIEKDGDHYGYKTDSKDPHSNDVILELYKKRMEEVLEETDDLVKSIPPDDVAGIEDLSVAFSDGGSDSDEYEDESDE